MMRSIAIAAVAAALGLFSIGAAQAYTARAGGFDLGEWCRQAEALVRSLSGDSGMADREVITPPADIDPKMVLVPPRPHGTMRVITAPARPGGGTI
jgi:hypothetical protein